EAEGIVHAIKMSTPAKEKARPFDLERKVTYDPRDPRAKDQCSWRVVNTITKPSMTKGYAEESSNASWSQCTAQDLDHLTEQEKAELMSTILSRKSATSAHMENVEEDYVMAGEDMRESTERLPAHVSGDSDYEPEINDELYNPPARVHFKQKVTDFTDEDLLPPDVRAGDDSGVPVLEPSSMASSSTGPTDEHVNDYEPEAKRLKIGEKLADMDNKALEFDWVTALEQEAEQTSHLDLYAALQQVDEVLTMEFDLDFVTNRQRKQFCKDPAVYMIKKMRDCE
ncbi:unnamed protein product, partial [Effrenium voratum]